MSVLSNDRIEFITCIVARGKGKQVIELAKEEGISYSLIMLGRGTADSETLSLLGLGETEKDIVMLTVSFLQRDLIMNKISERMHLDEPGHGIAFSIPLSAMALQPDTFDLLSGMLNKINQEHQEA